jgi:hypothetical protein
MTFRQRLVAASAAAFLVVPSAFAQPAPVSPAQAPSAQRQHIDGGDEPSNPRATDASAAAWRKQHIDGGDEPSNPRATDASSAAWHKTHPFDP